MNSSINNQGENIQSTKAISDLKIVLNALDAPS